MSPTKHPHHLTEGYLSGVARFETAFPQACAFLRRLQQDGPHRDLWLSTSVNAHLYKDAAFLAYLKLKNPERKPPSLVLSPRFNHQIVHGTTDQSARVFPALFDEILGQHGGQSVTWAVRVLYGATELTSQTPAAFFDSLADALLMRA